MEGFGEIPMLVKTIGFLVFLAVFSCLILFIKKKERYEKPAGKTENPDKF